MPKGYAGQILHIDLTNRTIDIENPPQEFTAITWGEVRKIFTISYGRCPAGWIP